MGILADFDLRLLRDRFGCRYLVETGTGRGGGIEYARQFTFDRIFSIEITPELASAARQRFAGHGNISVLNTDSETGLTEILSKLPADVPAVFWLDAHFPGADYGFAKYDSEADADRRLPLQRELELISRGRDVSRDVFLIDDLRIYEDGPFEMGSIGHFGSSILPERRGIGFIEPLLGRTHRVERLYFKTGYVVILPRSAGLSATEIHTLAGARAAFARGDAEEAERIADRYLRMVPNDSGALIVLALVARGRRQFVLARSLAQQVLATAPKHVDALALLGRAQQDLERFDEAEAAFRAAHDLAPGSAELQLDLGKLLVQRERLAEAVKPLRGAATADPSLMAAHMTLADALRRLGDAEGAAAALAHVTEFDDETGAAFAALAGLLHRGGTRLPLEVWRRLAGLLPADGGVQLRLSAALATARQRDEAIAILRRLVADEGQPADLLFETGKALSGLDDDVGAAIAYRKAIDRNPKHAAAHNNLAMILFLDGKFEEAWPHHEWRFEAKQRPRPPYPGAPLATADISGRTLFLHGEQGLGDNIQFLRYAKLLHERGNRIVVGVRQELVELFSAQPYIDSVVAPGGALPPFDFQLPLLSLPAVFRTRRDDVPAEIPYLRVPDAKLALWRERLQKSAKPRIGLAWAGNPGHYNDANRSIAGALFLRLTEAAPHEFVALQKPWPVTSPRPGDVRDLGAEFDDLADTAAALMRIDLVISIDSSVAHLAGALGRKVWILLPDPCDWRWTRAGEKTPWYPQARLFRQKKRGDWAELLEIVKVELAAFRPG